MADLLTLIVRYAHMVSAILWIGALGFSVMVLRPVMARIGMPARKDILKALIPAVVRFIPVSAMLTITFGAILYLMLGDFDPAVLWGTEWGRVLLVCLLLTLALFAFGVLVVIRASREILGHLNEDACSHGPEIGHLQSIFNRGQIAALVWGFAILSLMVLATEAL